MYPHRAALHMLFSMEVSTHLYSFTSCLRAVNTVSPQIIKTGCTSMLVCNGMADQHSAGQCRAPALQIILLQCCRVALIQWSSNYVMFLFGDELTQGIGIVYLNDWTYKNCAFFNLRS